MIQVGQTTLVRHRTLVVEDDRVARIALTKILQAMGQEVYTATTVAQGLEKLAVLPERMLLDLMLPDGSGLEILRRIRDANLDTRVAVTTSVTDPQILATVSSLRPDAVFEKPIHLPDLARWLNKPDAPCYALFQAGKPPRPTHHLRCTTTTPPPTTYGP